MKKYRPKLKVGMTVWGFRGHNFCEQTYQIIPGEIAACFDNTGKLKYPVRIKDRQNRIYRFGMNDIYLSLDDLLNAVERRMK